YLKLQNFYLRKKILNFVIFNIRPEQPVVKVIFIFKPTPMFNITAFVCTDETKEDSRVKYSQLTSLSGDQRRELYWKCAYTFFCASKKVNPDKPHILFTNDRREVKIKGIDIKSQLKEKGVEVRELRFAQFNPGGATNFFKNAFFRFE